MMNIGQQLKTRRETIGMTQAQVAQASGLCQQYIAEVESGKRNPTIANIEKITKALGTALTLE